MPANASKDDLEFFITPKEAPHGLSVKTLKIWDLRAEMLSDQSEKSLFDEEITLSYKFDPYDVRGMDWSSITLVTLDEETGEWIPLETSRDLDNLTVTAKTGHFSIFGAQASSAYAIPGQIMDFQVNLNSGSATFRYPIELPVGTGGFSPLNLGFSYNSASIDEMRSERDIGSMAGVGWSMDLPHIFFNEETQTYSIVVDGVSGRLVDDGAGTVYKTAPFSSLYVEREVGGGGVTWEARNSNGTVFEFNNRRYYQKNPCWTSQDYRWDLTKVTDVHGNTVEISWINSQIQHSEDPGDLPHRPSPVINSLFRPSATEA